MRKLTSFTQRCLQLESRVLQRQQLCGREKKVDHWVSDQSKVFLLFRLFITFFSLLLAHFIPSSSLHSLHLIFTQQSIATVCVDIYEEKKIP